MENNLPIVRFLKRYQDGLVASLKGVDLSNLVGEGVEKGIIHQTLKDSFESLDPNVSRPTKIRYLLLHACEQTKDNPRLFKRFLKVLDGHGVPSNVLESMQLNYDSYCVGSHVSTSAPSVAEGIGEVLCGSINDKVEKVGTKRSRNSSFTLSENHLSILTEILADNSSKWKVIGISLNLPFKVLEEIKDYMHKSSNISLYEMLREWVAGNHLHAKPPTVDSLEETLGSKFVGLFKEARQLQKNMEKHIQQVEGPFTSAKRMRLKCLPLEIVFKSCNIRITESNSALLEVQASIVSDETISYQWMRNGSPLSDGLRYSGTRKEILYIRSATIKSGGSYVCKLQSCRETVESDPIIVTIEVLPARKTLIDMYCFQPEVPEDSWPPVGNKYISLALRTINIAGKNTCSTARGDKDDILRDKDKVEYKEVFSNFEKGCLLLIEGRPGSGKTTLVHRICRDWAEKEILKGAKYVFLISLQNKTDLKLEDILNLFYCNNEKAVQDVSKHLNQFNGDSTCFIIDGLEEYSPQSGEDSVIFQIIHKKYFPHSMVIVVSPPVTRRVASKQVKQVEVVGFMREQITSYIKEYPFSDKVNTPKELESYLNLHHNVLHMCYLPVHVAMVSFLYEEMGKDIPQTETGIYEYFTLYTLLRKLRRSDKSIRLLRSLDNLQGKYMEYFRKVCELAFNMTANDKQFFEQDEFSLSDTTGSDKPSLGLVTIDCTAGLKGYSDLYTFLHHTLQEYLAAYHISKLDEEEQAKVISKYGKEEHMRVVWKFYCGLVNFKNSLPNFKGILLKSVDNDLFNIQCAFESQQSITCECVVQSGDRGCITLRNQFLTPFDFTALGYVMTNASSPVKKLVLDGEFGREGISALLKESGNKILSIKTFYVHGQDSVREQYQAVNMLLSL